VLLDIVAWFDVRYSDAGGCWYVHRTAQKQLTGFCHTEFICKCLAWSKPAGIEIRCGAAGALRIDAARLVFDTAQPGCVSFSNEAAAA
jgi:hypothetical protein